MTVEQQEPVFIVGAPRSGTTLLAALMSAHSGLSCGPETHFFRFLSKTSTRRLCKRSSWPDEAVAFLFSITQPGSPVPENYGLSDDAVAQYLKARSRSVASILCSLTEQYMIRLSKRRWIEKTPEHLVHLSLIRRHFPEAFIVRIVRDPRDIVLSWTKTWRRDSFLEVLHRLREYEHASAGFTSSDPRTYTVKYEDLLTSPSEQLEQVCRFIGEEFEPGMLNTSESITHVNRIGEPWKTNAGNDVDPGRGNVWCRELSSQSNRLAEALVGDQLQAHGYATEESFDQYAQLTLCARHHFREASFWSRLHEWTTGLVDRGFRFWPASEREPADLIAYAGQPTDWLGDGTWIRRVRTLRYVQEIVGAQRSGTPLLWLSDEPKSPLGRCGNLLARLLDGNRLKSPDGSTEHADSTADGANLSPMTRRRVGA